MRTVHLDVTAISLEEADEKTDALLAQIIGRYCLIVKMRSCQVDIDEQIHERSADGSTVVSRTTFTFRYTFELYPEEE